MTPRPSDLELAELAEALGSMDSVHCLFHWRGETKSVAGWLNSIASTLRSSQAWIPVTPETMPKEEDKDCCGNIWVSTSFGVLLTGWPTAYSATHWMRTGMVRPSQPAQEK